MITKSSNIKQLLISQKTFLKENSGSFYKENKVRVEN
jgi:hypothetical protein